MDSERVEGAVRRPHPGLSRWILWVTGVGGLLLTLAGSFSEPNPGRAGSRIAGFVVFAIVSGAAVGSAYLMTRRPRLARILGLVAAGGAVFIGWALMRAESSLPGALVAIAIAAVGLVVAWQLVRWSPQEIRPS